MKNGCAIPSRREHRARRGASLVEFSFILPVFGLLMMGILEFGHIYMVYNTMTAAAKRGARYGSVAGVTNSDVVTRVSDVLDSAIDTSNAEILVKDASIFDTPEVDTTTIQYEDLVDVSIDQLGPRQLFLVYITIPYNDVAILPPFWANNLTLTTQSVMRHE